MAIRIIIGLAAGAVIGSIIGYFGRCSSGICPLTSSPCRGALYGAVWGVLLALLLR